MGCRFTSTERRPSAALPVRLVAALCALLFVAQARAHEPSRINTREIVRVAGWFGTPPAGEAVARDVALTVQGKQRAFHATEWQVFALVVEPKESIPPLPESVTVQGSREVLARIAAARAEQRVSILAERRSGSGELFVLALDLCPAK